MPLRRLTSLLAVLVAALAGACGSDGAATPEAPAGPANVIAFGGQGPDGGGLFTVKPDGTGLMPAVAEEGAVSHPVWSPGGGRIAYVVGADGAGLALRVHDFAAGATVTVSEQALAPEFGPAASWSPDGRRLAFTESGSDGALVRVYDVERGEVDAELMVAGAAPAWSPDGATLVFAGGDGEPGLHQVDAGGGARELLLERPGAEGSPVWSPDGGRIAFAAGDEDASDLLVLEVESGDVRELGRGLTPGWSRDGARVAFAAPGADDADLDIYYADVVGREPALLGASVTRDLWPSWSPDGGRIAYLGQVDVQTAFICVVRLDPEERDCLDLQGILPGAPAWSPR